MSQAVERLVKSAEATGPRVMVLAALEQDAAIQLLSNSMKHSGLITRRYRCPPCIRHWMPSSAQDCAGAFPILETVCVSMAHPKTMTMPFAGYVAASLIERQLFPRRLLQPNCRMV